MRDEAIGKKQGQGSGGAEACHGVSGSRQSLNILSRSICNSDVCMKVASDNNFRV
jgi:hypothetical protein